MVVELQHGMGPGEVAQGAVLMLSRVLQAPGGVIAIGRDGPPHAAFNTPAMPYAIAQ
jgi:isoaspartyl peptidase/L-asparaginase-like protein (Ntn-hydrolase superfamily)